jgi:hypothetical protein
LSSRPRRLCRPPLVSLSPLGWQVKRSHLTGTTLQKLCNVLMPGTNKLVERCDPQSSHILGQRDFLTVPVLSSLRGSNSSCARGGTMSDLGGPQQWHCAWCSAYRTVVGTHVTVIIVQRARGESKRSQYRCNTKNFPSSPLSHYLWSLFLAERLRASVADQPPLSRHGCRTFA